MDRPPLGAGATSRRLLAALFALTGTAHVLAPEAFESIVPDRLPGRAAWWNGAATVTELTAAALLSRHRTAALGGRVALVTLAGVWAANVQAAADGGYRALPSPLDSAAVAWVRVPLQLPLLWWAWRIARRAPGG